MVNCILIFNDFPKKLEKLINEIVYIIGDAYNNNSIFINEMENMFAELYKCYIDFHTNYINEMQFIDCLNSSIDYLESMKEHKYVKEIYRLLENFRKSAFSDIQIVPIDDYEFVHGKN